MKDRVILLPKAERNNRYQNFVKEPKKNLQVYISQETFKKMLNRIDEMTLSEMTEKALVAYL